MRRTLGYLVFVPGLLAPALAGADEIFLKGGAKFTGRIESQTDTMVTINLGDGVVGVAMARVDRIVKGRSPLDEYEDRAKALAPQDLDGWRGLGAWALHQGLSAQARDAYGKVMALAPDDPEARAALGYVKYDGRWMTEEESYAARGYVKMGGEWMTQAAAQSVQNAQAAEQGRQDAERRANQAEADKILAESRAAKAEERAREAAEVDPWSQIGTWTGWGWGVVGWPAGTTVNMRPGYSLPQNTTQPN
ncbi:MAG TPA: hypothetical protein VJV75_12500 [Candidatus Polarisedimenticolia bacterium]|nr:hypothetical protein [Candidatus Polarisedimenticolia bacterium]